MVEKNNPLFSGHIGIKSAMIKEIDSVSFTV
jgi:hypothetical protein